MGLREAGSFVAGAAVVKMIPDFSRFGDEVKRNVGGLDKQISGFGSALTKSLTVPIAAAGAVSVKMASDFGKAMELVHTQAGASQREVDGLKNKVLALAPTVATGPKQLADALFHIESAGFRGSAAMDALTASAKLAKVGNADLEQVTNALVGIVNSGVGGVKDFNDAVAQMNAVVGSGNMRMDDLTSALATGILPTAKLAGLSFKDVGAAIAFFTSQGIPAVDAANRLRATILGLMTATPKAKKDLEGIGLSTQVLASDMRKGGLIQAMQDLKDHMEKAGLTATQQAQLMTDVFTKRAATAPLGLIQNLDKLRATQDNVTQGAGKFGDAWKKTQEDAAFQFEKLKASAETLAVKVGVVLLPYVVKIADALSKFFDWVEKLSPSTQKLVLAILGFAAAAGPALIIVGKFATAIRSIHGLFSGLNSAKAATQIKNIGTAAEVAEGEVAVATSGMTLAFGALAAGIAGYQIGTVVEKTVVKPIIDHFEKLHDKHRQTLSDMVTNMNGAFHKMGLAGSQFLPLELALQRLGDKGVITSKNFDNVSSHIDILAAAIKNHITITDSMLADLAAGGDRARAAIQRIQDAIDNLHDRTIQINIAENVIRTTTTAPGVDSSGNYNPVAAMHSGFVPSFHAGHMNLAADEFYAKLQAGEAVINATATKRFAPLLRFINSNPASMALGTMSSLRPAAVPASDVGGPAIVKNYNLTLTTQKASLGVRRDFRLMEVMAQ